LYRRNNEHKVEYDKIFNNSYELYVDLFQRTIIEDTYTGSKRKHFIKGKKGTWSDTSDDGDACSECHKPFETSFYFFKKKEHCHFCHNDI
jgi:hypothetical protein